MPTRIFFFLQNIYIFRDPNFLNTLKSFTNGVEWAKNGRFTKQDVDEAKLAIFAQV